MQKIHEMQVGQNGNITDIIGDKRFLSRITSVGLTIGCNVKMLRNEKKYPLLLYSRDSVIALNRGESNNIKVEVIS